MNESERIKLKMKKDRNNDMMFYICVIMFVALAICLRIVAYANRYQPDPSLYVEYDLSKDIIPDPIQKKVDRESFTIQKYGMNITLTKLASYDITGKVVGLKDFSGNFFSNYTTLNNGNYTLYISPRDLALSWGKIALDENEGFLKGDQDFFNGQRIVLWDYDYELVNKYGKEYIESHISNNHIITLDKNITKELMKIKESDIVRTKGYLVDTKADNGMYWGPSSLSREDDGCEIVYAEDIVIMSQKKK